MWLPEHIHVDDSDFDNILSSPFSITDGATTGILALSDVDGAGMPLASTYPSNSTTEYQGCMMIQEPNASVMAVQGLYFVPHTDTSVNSLAGAEIFANAYQWDDGWVETNSPITLSGARHQLRVQQPENAP